MVGRVHYSSIRFATARSGLLQLTPVRNSSLQFATAHSGLLQLAPVRYSSLRFATARSGSLFLLQLFLFFEKTSCYFLPLLVKRKRSRKQVSNNSGKLSKQMDDSFCKLATICTIPDIYWINSRYIHCIYVHTFCIQFSIFLPFFKQANSFTQKARNKQIFAWILATIASGN